MAKAARQVLLDLHPDVAVTLPLPGGDVTAEPIRDLLPRSYSAPDPASGPRIVYFNPRYYDSVASGQKTITTRHHDPIQAGPAVLVFDDGDTIRRLTAQIESVESRRFEHLTTDDAHQEDRPDADALRGALRTHYPDLDGHDVVDVARFHLMTA